MKIAVSIFKAVFGVLDDVRIAVNFPEYERQARTRHIAAGERRFSTVDLETEALRRMADAVAASDQQFGRPLGELNRALSALQLDLQVGRDRLALFQRDYKTELDSLYAHKSQVSEEYRAVKSSVQQAYDDLEEASDDLDRWHSKSRRGFFGNGGKKLPKHSFFGQSIGDRESLKGDRDSAGSDIDSCKRDQAKVKQKLDAAFGQIDQVKEDRAKMFNLRDQGLSNGGLMRLVTLGEGHIADTRQDIEFLASGRDQFILAAKHRTGTIGLESEIEKIRALKAHFLKAFDDAATATQRKAEHRATWLKQKGR